MKKVLCLMILVALVLVPATSATYNLSSAAKSTYAVGLNIGTNTGIGFQYRVNKDFDLIGNLGLEYFGISRLSFDVAANYKVSQFSIENADFIVTVGLGGLVAIPLESGVGFDLSALVPVGLVYSFDKDVAPIDIYLRLAPGLRIIQNNSVHLGLGFSGYLGALWRFD
ncbi:hypothetical protein [uncultured Sphaerochaeta sp.]|uniref:hypothetical protein n=1 Tax=uncultured Sphaerochaeta sp. TaxID=886478 RepID=UPI002A0A6118|nr:hypothetical protein [uncultured Sphaerochaeta sp.]